jgi:hypothetical protein
LALERVLVLLEFELLLMLLPLLLLPLLLLLLLLLPPPLLLLALLWFLVVVVCEGRGAVAAEGMVRPVVSSVPWL